MSEKIVVKIDPDLEDLIPGFLNNRRSDVESLKSLLAAQDFDAIQLIGHSMKGAGGGYGFDEITTIGSQLERAATERDRDAIATATDSLADYLERIEPVFEE